MKKEVWENEDLGCESLDLQELKDLIDKVETHGWSNFRIKISFHGCYDSGELACEYSRLETDEEYEKRTQAEKKESEKRTKAMLAKQEKERKLYEKLKKQFDP